MQDSEKADILNQFFSSYFVKDDNNNPTFPKRVSNEFTLTSVQITPAIVFAAIRSIKPSNSLDVSIGVYKTKTKCACLY